MALTRGLAGCSVSTLAGWRQLESIQGKCGDNGRLAVIESWAGTVGHLSGWMPIESWFWTGEGASILVPA